MENAYTLARQTAQPAVTSISLANELIISQAVNLRDLSWNKANQILETQYGSAAVRGLDSTADVVDKLIDRYFPAIGDEQSVGELFYVQCLSLTIDYLPLMENIWVFVQICAKFVQFYEYVDYISMN